ncbi:MAG: membrane protein insertase YidC [Ignavibacteria bacterium]|nr:membrane protein insertase YidC [Ignavibacteria bacterium]
MDKRSLLAVVMITMLMAFWMFMQQRSVDPQAAKPASAPTATAGTSKSQISNSERNGPPVQFMPAPQRTIVVTSDLYTIRFTSEGALVRSWVLNNYKPHYAKSEPGAVVDLIQPGVHEFGFSFLVVPDSMSSQRPIDTLLSREIPFTFDATSDSIVVAKNDTVRLTATAATAFGGVITRTYEFTGGAYDVTSRIVMTGMQRVYHRRTRTMLIEWKNGIRYQEGSSVDESNNAVGIIAEGGSLTEIDATDFSQPVGDTSKTNIDYLATRSKYFAVAMLPQQGFAGKASVYGQRNGAPDEGVVERYSLGVEVPMADGNIDYTTRLYVGPMQYDTLEAYGLTNIMNFGWKWIVKPIGEYFMLPTFKFIHNLIPNYGIAIILFALLMKVLLYPLSTGQLESAKKMQLVAPLLNEVRMRYPDDMQKQQQETMKIYSEYGINPAGGCLPLVLQMPFLYALYAVLNLNIELRQQGFLPVWLTDLSIPDVIFSLPFKLPLFNIDQFSGLALLMGTTMFIQQKQAISDPRQKAMVYMMPLMLTLMFSSLPSGLNLYYFVFNVVAIGQTIWQKKFSKNQLTLADLKKMPKKESWMQRKIREAQEMAAAQGRLIPGQPTQRPQKPSKPGKKK